MLARLFNAQEFFFHFFQLAPTVAFFPQPIFSNGSGNGQFLMAPTWRSCAFIVFHGDGKTSMDFASQTQRRPDADRRIVSQGQRKDQDFDLSKLDTRPPRGVFVLGSIVRDGKTNIVVFFLGMTVRAVQALVLRSNLQATSFIVVAGFTAVATANGTRVLWELGLKGSGRPAMP